jgi:hypothetical protein
MPLPIRETFTFHQSWWCNVAKLEGLRLDWLCAIFHILQLTYEPMRFLSDTFAHQVLRA